MEKFDLGTVIAERRFLLPDGKRITVKIGMPRRLDDGNFFSCPYKILGVQKEVTRRAGGIDAVQAIQSAFQNIGSLLSVLNELYGNALAWEGGEKGDLGFPLPQDTLDVLTDQPNAKTATKTSVKPARSKHLRKKQPLKRITKRARS